MPISCRRSKSIGQGIFTLFSEDAKKIQDYIQDSMKLDAERRKAANGSCNTGSSSGVKSKLNPLSFLFKSGGGGGDGGSAGLGSKVGSSVSGKTDERGAGGGEEKVRRDRGRRKVLEKSKSMMDRSVLFCSFIHNSSYKSNCVRTSHIL